MSTNPAHGRRPRREESVDEAIAESFPASDPPAYSRITRDGAPPRGLTPKHAAPQADRAQTEEKKA